MQLFKRNRDGEGKLSAAVAERASTAADQFGRIVEQGADQANAALATAREQGEKAAEQTSEMLSDFRSTVESQVRAQPITALLFAAVAGLVFGSFLRSGDK